MLVGLRDFVASARDTQRAQLLADQTRRARLGSVAVVHHQVVSSVCGGAGFDLLGLELRIPPLLRWADMGRVAALDGGDGVCRDGHGQRRVLS